MNAKDEMLIEEQDERIIEERNDKMFNSLANAFGSMIGSLRGNSTSIPDQSNTAERALLELQMQVNRMKEELDSLKQRVGVVEKEVFQVIERKPPHRD